MRPLLVLAFCCGSISLLQAQEASTVPPHPPETSPQSKPAPPPPTGRIIGTVFCADTHRPARGAVVMLQPRPGEGGTGVVDHSARVAMDGSYSLDWIPQGEYAVVVALPGYLNPLDGVIIDFDEKVDAQNETWKRVSANGTVTVRENNSSRFDIELKRGATVSGRVLYSDGSPATQIVIAVEPSKSNRGADTASGHSFDFSSMMRVYITRQSVTTDDEGNFRISGLSTGAYRISAIHPSPNFSQSDRGGFPLDAVTDPLAVRVYAGDTLHQKQARTYNLRAGEVLAGVTITIPVEAFHTVSGHLSAIDGRPLNAATLSLTDPSDKSFSMIASLQPDGSFRFPSVFAGTYTLASKDARITEVIMRPQPGGEAYAETVSRWAFADSTQSLIVKDADLTDINFALKEVPLPPDPEKDSSDTTGPATQPAQPQ